MSIDGEDRGGSFAAEDTMVGEGSPRSSSNSSSNKVKFMCSYGGKILPRPSDGVLKYVGGDTRVVAVSRDISFSELMKKLTELSEHQTVVLKYQTLTEDLDALVSIKSDQDLIHMLEELDHREALGIPKLRAFLFPADSTRTTNLDNCHHQMDVQTSTEQRYIEAINGCLVRVPIKTSVSPCLSPNPRFSISACSSPKSESSPEGNGHEEFPFSESGFSNNHGKSPLNRIYKMHKVKSSPNMYHHQQQQQHHHHHQYSYYPSPPRDGRMQTTGWGPANHGGSSRRSRSGRFVVGYDDNGGSGYSSHRGRASSVPQSPRSYGYRI